MEIAGDNSLLLYFSNGNWAENDFTIIPPNHKVAATNNEDIIGYSSL